MTMREHFAIQKNNSQKIVKIAFDSNRKSHRKRNEFEPKRKQEYECSNTIKLNREQKIL